MYVTFTKRNQNTDAVVRQMSDALGVSARDVGVAGLKDRLARTTQTVSFPLGPKLAASDAEARLTSMQTPDLRIDAISRHGNKLRTGHLRGNRFTLWVRGATHEEIVLANARLARARTEGIPNAFGDQRFGRHGDNAEHALAFVRGEGRPPRDPRRARFLFSAFQSHLFNTLLDERVADGSWAIPTEGELVMRHRKVDQDEEEDARGALFLCTAAELEEVRARALRHEVSPTGPMWGAKMRKPSSTALDRELELLARFGVEEAMLQRFSRLGEGVRRSLRLFPEKLQAQTSSAKISEEPESIDSTNATGVHEAKRSEREENLREGENSADVHGAKRSETDMQLQFVLPKGAYATEVLAWLFPGGLSQPPPTEAKPLDSQPPSSRTSP